MRKTKKKIILFVCIALVILFLTISLIVHLHLSSKNDLTLNTAEKIESVILQDSLPFQKVVETIRSVTGDGGITIRVDMNIDEPVPTVRLLRIDNISYSMVIDPTDPDEMDEECFESTCRSIHEEVRTLIDNFHLRGILILRGRIRFLFEITKNGYAAELLYVDEKIVYMSSIERMIPQSILDRKKINDHWFAIVSCDPEYTP